MSRKNIALFCLLILLNASACALENKGRESLNQKGFIDKMLAAIATSGVMHSHNQIFGKDPSHYGVSASEDIQKLGTEAQAAVGISVNKQVPVQYMSKLDASAVAQENAIVVGREFTNNKVAYGVKRCNMFHEAVHVKYNDCSFNAVFLEISLVGLLLGTKLFINPQGKSKLLYLLSLFAGHFVGRALQGKFEDYRERRADIEGHYATQCHVCVTEKIADVRVARELAQDIIARVGPTTNFNRAQLFALAYVKDWIESKTAYLSIEENEIIAAELKRDNKICTFHEQSK